MTNRKQLSLLKSSVEDWNRWREENEKIEVDLSHADLSNCDLSEADLRKAKLEGTNFKSADLRYAKFNQALLSDADFSDANLWGAELTNATLYSVVFREANLNNADFSGSWSNGANFEKADLRESTLQGTHLNEANLSDSDLGDADLSWATLSDANLSGVNLDSANLSKATLIGANLNLASLELANLESADLREADLSASRMLGATLKFADLRDANLREADLTGVDFIEAKLSGVNLSDAILNDADLTKADLTYSNLVNVKVDRTKMSNSKIYGISVWDLVGEPEEQKDLVITRDGEPVITVDNIKIAQFIYLILNNEEIRDVINTLTSKSVLILGRFAIPERKSILDSLREKLREYDLLPIVFDFDRPVDKDFTETIKTLAGLSYFVIADVTNPKSSPLELQATVPDYQIPFVPIIQEGESPFAMMVDLQKKYNWVLNTVSYDSQETLMKALKPLIIDPAMKKRQELRIIKAHEPEIISAKDFLAKGKV